MPHLLISGTDTEKIIEEITIHASIRFKRDFFVNHAPRVKQKLDELEQKLTNVLEYYFANSNLSIEQVSNHEWNVNFNEQQELELYERNGG